MKNILFLLGNYYPNSSANGVCVHAVVDDLKKRGNNIFVICYGSDNQYLQIEDERIYTVKSNHFLGNKYYSGKVGGIRRKLFLLASLISEPPYPIIGNKMKKLFQKRIMDILADHTIDIIVSVVQPIDSALALSDSLFKNHKCILYELDTISDDLFLETSWRRFFLCKISKIEDKLYSRFDKIIYMKSHESFFENRIIANKKFKMADIPLINADYYNEVNKDDESKNTVPHIVYAGSLSSQIRPPNYILDIFMELYKKALDFKVFFYSRGCNELINSYSKRMNSAVIQKGYVSQEELTSIYRNADFLLNIGNLAENVLPSKIIQYISTGKPIIHVSNSNKDACFSYLQSYTNTCIINISNNFDDNVDKLYRFIVSNKNSIVPYSIIRQSFNENTIEWTSSQIEN